MKKSTKKKSWHFSLNISDVKDAGELAYILSELVARFVDMKIKEPIEGEIEDDNANQIGNWSIY